MLIQRFLDFFKDNRFWIIQKTYFLVGLSVFYRSNRWKKTSWIHITVYYA
jgi:hypothetical protein